MTQNQLPPDLKKIVAVGPFLGSAAMGYDIEPGSFSVGAHNTASWKCDKRKIYCHLSQIAMLATEGE